MNPERNKGGRKPNPDGLPRKAWQVYGTAEDINLCRLVVKLSPEQKEFIRIWMEKGATVKYKGK